MDDAWWEGTITNELDNGNFHVYVMDFEDHLDFTGDHLRVHKEWVDGSWIPSLEEDAAEKTLEEELEDAEETDNATIKDAILKVPADLNSDEDAEVVSDQLTLIDHQKLHDNTSIEQDQDPDEKVPAERNSDEDSEAKSDQQALIDYQKLHDNTVIEQGQDPNEKVPADLNSDEDAEAMFDQQALIDHQKLHDNTAIEQGQKPDENLADGSGSSYYTAIDQAIIQIPDPDQIEEEHQNIQIPDRTEEVVPRQIIQIPEAEGTEVDQTNQPDPAPRRFYKLVLLILDIVSVAIHVGISITGHTNFVILSIWFLAVLLSVYATVMASEDWEPSLRFKIIVCVCEMAKIALEMINFR
ncbi:hypothetical protein CCACVL1_20039 [Corchorus capsularis]|uniref:Agenet domain-containing protein n=1 Tax=Corchorus capsularis TaxID=210143 RepID=A0A1R3HCU1_COCAP|nr:hypothetical protein CCACVL1_20039 [Corchorus capsularis]